MPTLTFTRDQLIEALEGRRKWAEDYDRRNLAAHEKAEKDYLRRFRERCREMAKWSYDDIKKDTRYGSPRVDVGDRPSCPRSAVAALDRELNVVRASRQHRFSVSGGSTNWSGIFWLLTHDETIEDDLCA